MAAKCHLMPRPGEARHPAVGDHPLRSRRQRRRTSLTKPHPRPPAQRVEPLPGERSTRERATTGVGSTTNHASPVQAAVFVHTNGRSKLGIGFNMKAKATRSSNKRASHAENVLRPVVSRRAVTCRRRGSHRQRRGQCQTFSVSAILHEGITTCILRPRVREKPVPTSSWRRSARK
jgi:hypothetical protein